MEKNPLTEEQLKKLQEISKLPSEEQQAEAQKFWGTLTQEQQEYFKKQQAELMQAQAGGQGQVQGQECIFCQIASGKIPAKKVYEDDEVLAFLDINPLNVGHTLIIPKKHFEVISDVPDGILNNLTKVIKKVSTALLKTSDGLNIIQNNKKIAGQVVPHVHFHIVPRHENDKIKFEWPTKKVSEKDLDQALEKIKKEIPEELEEVKQKKKRIKKYKEKPRIP